MPFTLNSHDPTPGAPIPSSWGDAMNANQVALNNFFYAPLFPESSGMVDSNTVGMLYSVVSGAAGTPVFEIPVLSANGTATSGRKWTKTMPPSFGGSLYIAGNYYMPVLGSGNFVIGVRISAFSVGGTLTGESFATQVKGTVTASTVANKLAAFSLNIPSANINSLIAGNPVQIEFERLPADAGDTEGGTVNFVNIDAYYNLIGY